MVSMMAKTWASGMKAAFAAASLFAVAATAAAAQTATVPADGTEQPLHFSVTEGKIHNEFFRAGPSAAHTVLTSGAKPRLIVAFPAGNSGVSLWFDKQDQEAVWQPLENIKPIRQETEAGTLYGIEATVAVRAKTLRVNRAVLGNIRAIRIFMHESTVDSRLVPMVKQDQDSIRWSRVRLDRKGGYELSIKMLAGMIGHAPDGKVQLSAADDGLIRFQMRALTGDTPLTPIAMPDLLNANVGDDPLSRDILAFLTYKEKMLAGSWRFNTYFGRDTLLSTALLMPVFEPPAVEAAVTSVLNRLAPNGQVAHEEDIAEFAVTRQLEISGKAEAIPVYDYAMVDEGYMLTPVLARYMAMGSRHKAHLENLLKKKSPGGELYGDLLMGNVRYVFNHAQLFADHPTFENLIAIKQGSRVGDWRDSQEGLGNGRYSYSVNAVLVPSALDAIKRLAQAGMIGDQEIAKKAADMAQVWTNHAPALFETAIPADTAQARINAYAKAQGVPAITAEPGPDGLVRFPALSLNAEGDPVQVVQSDPAFLLFFNDPDAARLDMILRQIAQPYPAGLMTPVGMLVANPAYESTSIQAIFTKGHYHGPVVWPWQQAMMAAGLDRQLARRGLPENTRKSLQDFRTKLWAAIQNGHPVRTAELWSWEYIDGTYLAVPYGQGHTHLTESNAAQLWSTVYLAVSPPE